MRRVPIFLVGVAVVSVALLAQTPTPTFDVVSIKLNTMPPGPGSTAPPVDRPDGGITYTGMVVSNLIGRGYGHVPADMVGLPDWATRDRYNVSATASLAKATREDRAAMIRAMLVDRFKLAVHIEMREKSGYDLVVAREDRKLGPGLTPIDTDCGAVVAAMHAAPAPPPTGRPDFTKPPPPCTLRIVGSPTLALLENPHGPGDVMEGETTLTDLATALRISTTQPVTDKTGLAGSYRIRMEFDQRALRRPADVSAPSGIPSVFDAVRDQLGLRLVSTKTPMEVLVIDHLERPTEN